MKAFTIFALAGLLACVSALPQDSQPQQSQAPLPPSVLCANKCADADVCCKADCFHVPCPNNAMANDTTACTAKCPKGDGSPGATEKYAQCVGSCIKQHFFSATSAMPNPTGTAGTPTGSSGSGGETTGNGSQTGASQTGATSSASPSAGAAANNAQLGSSAAGIIGLLMAALAL
ncbi:conserved hypothetical protein [Histoplasma capsulatum var. duboisii H88]|uniref:Uncharacterized protein n=2 Tax=Ajellomyces capsulatus TaxID=5037 RepID=F0UL72_AJEC8|nr:conserved hypothetical protein [Histoplasma capsulatum H143]EGC46176.1 conserved hypothetical protein [Histoplasma capsulatum var. duboisii H88]QSS56800.1 hypothetical protein I7I53_05108 [Histoplasma capsulatum var. duboisii H88]